MLRRSFLKGAAALAAAPVLPAAPASIDGAMIADGAVTVACYRNCMVMCLNGFKVYDAAGDLRVIAGHSDDLSGMTLARGQQDRDLGPVQYVIESGRRDG